MKRAKTYTPLPIVIYGDTDKAVMALKRKIGAARECEALSNQRVALTLHVFQFVQANLQHFPQAHFRAMTTRKLDEITTSVRNISAFRDSLLDCFLHLQKQSDPDVFCAYEDCHERRRRSSPECERHFPKSREISDGIDMPLDVFHIILGYSR